MVMIESMVCGTPVVAYGRGSMPEVVDEGVTGHLVRDLADAARAVDAAVRAVEDAVALDRRRCRRRAVARFSAFRMVSDYLDVYAGVLASR